MFGQPKLNQSSPYKLLFCVASQPSLSLHGYFDTDITLFCQNDGSRSAWFIAMKCISLAVVGCS